MRILIVDDNQYARESVIEYLKISNMDVQVDEARSGQEAEEKVSNNTYDLILLDISMPDINGIEVLKYIRKTDKKVTVLITSVLFSDIQIKKAYDEGICDYLAKPFEMDKLVEWIERINGQKD